MGNPYIKKEVSKIIEEHEYPKNLALTAAWIMAHFKGINLKIYDSQDNNSLCDYNIIGSAENTTQARAIIDEIQDNLMEAGAKLVSLEGVNQGDWILLDMGDVIVHLFQDTSRDYFDLDSLWTNQKQIEIPQEYYFGKQQSITEEDGTENFF